MRLVLGARQAVEWLALGARRAVVVRPALRALKAEVVLAEVWPALGARRPAAALVLVEVPLALRAPRGVWFAQEPWARPVAV